MSELKRLHEAATPAPWYAAIPKELGDDNAEDYALVLLDSPVAVAWNREQHKEGKPWYFDSKFVISAWTSEMGGVVMSAEDARLLVALRNAYANGELVEKAAQDA